MKSNTRILVGAIALALFFAALLVLGNTGAANATKFSGLSVFSEESYHYQLFDRRMSFKNPTGLAAKLYANSATMILEHVYTNITSILSTEFLLIHGGSHGSHDIYGIGNISLVAAVFALIGFGIMITNRARGTHSQLESTLLAWFALSFVAPIITLEAAHSIRFSPALFAFAAAAGYGGSRLYAFLGSQKQRVFFTFVVAAVFLHGLTQTLGTYFVIYPQRDHHVWPWYHAELSQDLLSLKDEYAEILMPQVDSSPYIFLLFDWKYDPSNLQENLSFYPTDSGGFKHAQKLENISFTQIDWESFVASSQKKLAFIEESEFSKLSYNEADIRVLKVYTSNNAQKTYLLVSND